MYALRRSPDPCGRGVTVRNTGNLDVEASSSTYSLVIENGGKVTLEAGLGCVYRVGGARALVPGDEVPELAAR